jgi:beta-glucosidase
MSGDPLQSGLGGVDWGVATSDSLAASTLGAEASGGCSGHFHEWADDIRHLVGAGVTTHRAVAGWPQLQPDGPGSWDAAALDRCDRAIDAMLARGLRPSVTLLHLALPPWVAAAGGWLARESAQYFADYAGVLGARLGDRVARWITSTDLAGPSLADHVAGMYPHSRGIGMAGLPSVHHLLLGHGLAVQALRASGATGEIGTTVTVTGAYPATGDPWDRLAVERLESWTLRMFLDPLLLGEHMVTEDGDTPVEATGCVRDGDMAVIATPQDILGLSWHNPLRVTAPENLPGLLPTLGCFRELNEVNRLLVRLGFALVPFDEVETTAYGWPLIPEALADSVAAVHDLYGELLPPLAVIDNGMGDLDLVDADGRTDAARRRAVRGARLSWLARVAAAGVPLRSYEYWSVLDNADTKLRYAQLYAVAVPDHETLPQPACPSDWTHSGAFGAPVRAASGPCRLAVVGGTA